MRRRLTALVAGAVAAAAAVTVGAGVAHAANLSVCAAYCDGRGAGQASTDRSVVTNTIWSRVLTLHVSDPDNMAWASVDNGVTGDEVWLDRSFDGGVSWATGSKLGDRLTPSGTGTRTLMYNVDDPANRGVGAVRACGRASGSGHTDVACTPWARSSVNAQTPADAGATALMQFWSPSTGLWGNWWQNALALTTMIDYLGRSGDPFYRYVIGTTFDDNKTAVGGSFTSNGSIDDTGWWGLAWLAAYDYTGDGRYLSMARTDADYMYQTWDNTCGGGVWWSTAKTYKNAIPNELFLELAAGLHNRIAGDTTYLSRATAEWNWFSGSHMIGASGLVNDGLTSGCQNNGGTTWSYNQGVVLAGVAELYIATGNSSPLNAGNVIATAAVHALATDGILTEPCEPACDHNGASFKGIFVRDLDRFATVAGTSRYAPFLAAQSAAITAHDRTADGQYGLRWAGPVDSVDAYRQQSGQDPMDSTLPALVRYPPAQGAITGTTGECVDVADSGTADGTAVQVHPCEDTGAQRWQRDADGSLSALGKCLDVTHSGTAAGTLVQLYTCNGSGAQQWRPSAGGGLTNPESGRCLDVSNSAATDGARLQISDCTADAAQQWQLPG